MEIKEGSNVVIVDNSGNRRVLKIKQGKRVKHFKVMLDLGQLIGKHFGTHHLVVDPKSGDIEQITDVKELTKAFLDEPMIDAENNGDEEGENIEDEEEEVKEGDVLGGKDNRDIVDNN